MVFAPQVTERGMLVFQVALSSAAAELVRLPSIRAELSVFAAGPDLPLGRVEVTGPRTYVNIPLPSEMREHPEWRELRPGGPLPFALILHVSEVHLEAATTSIREFGRPEALAIEARKAVGWLKLDVVIPKVIPKAVVTAPVWFQQLVDFVRAQRGTGSLFLDRETGFPDLWAMFRDTQFTADQEDQMLRDLAHASPEEQDEAWAVLENNAALFGASTTRQQWQLAQRNDFPEFSGWQTLEPFRSVDEHACVYAVAVESGRQPYEPDPLRKTKGEVFRLAAVIRDAKRGEPTTETSFAVNDAKTAASLRDVRWQVLRWFGWPCFALLLEYMIRGDVIFVALPRVLRLATSAFELRRRIEESDVYFVARPALATPLAGQSLVAPAFAALLVSLFRSSGHVDLWMKVFPRMSNAAFSGHIDKWREIPIDAVPAKLSLLEKSDYKIRWAFFARPEERCSVRDTSDFKVRFCESVRVMMRHAMEVPWTFLAVNVVSHRDADRLPARSQARFCKHCGRLRSVASVAGVDSSIDAESLSTVCRCASVRDGRSASASMRADLRQKPSCWSGRAASGSMAQERPFC